MTLRSVLIANRGEIAVRIIRAAKALGLRTVLAHSIADKESLAAQLADETVEIGPPAAKKSYLNIEAVVNAAKSAKVDAVHPGYGFLAENAEFAEAVTAAGIVFVGPSAEAIRLLGDKVMARQVAALAGVPTVPGSDGRVTDLDAAITIANSIGYPVMIKAAAGGGGRGIRIVGDAEEFARQFPQASSEAAAAFGGRRCGKRRRRSGFPTMSGSGSAPAPSRSAAPSAIAAQAQSNISTTTRRARSTSSRSTPASRSSIP